MFVGSGGAEQIRPRRPAKAEDEFNYHGGNPFETRHAHGFEPYGEKDRHQFWKGRPDDQFDENFHRYQEYEQNGYSMQDAQSIYDSFFGRGNDPFETFTGFGRNDGGSNKRRVIVQTTTTTVEHESDSFFNLGNGPSFQMLGNKDDGYM